MERWDGISGGCIAQCRIPWSFTSPMVEGGERHENGEMNPTMCREERATTQGSGPGAAVLGAHSSQGALGSTSCSDTDLQLDTRHGTAGYARF